MSQMDTGPSRSSAKSGAGHREPAGLAQSRLTPAAAEGWDASGEAKTGAARLWEFVVYYGARRKGVFFHQR